MRLGLADDSRKIGRSIAALNLTFT